MSDNATVEDYLEIPLEALEGSVNQAISMLAYYVSEAVDLGAFPDTIHIKHRAEDYCDPPGLMVSYLRMETEKEHNARVKESERRDAKQAAKVAKDKKLLMTLLNKYGRPPEK